MLQVQQENLQAKEEETTNLKTLEKELLLQAQKEVQKEVQKIITN